MKEIYDVQIISKYLKNDKNKLQRLSEIENIEHIINIYPGIKIGINADWGAGKTVFAKMIYYGSNSLLPSESQEKFNKLFPYLIKNRVIYFDSSKEDIFNNPLLSIAKVVSDDLEKHFVIKKNKVVPFLHKLLCSTIKLIPGTTPIVDTIEDVSEVLKDEPILDDLFSTQKIIDTIKELFDSNEKYILIIDELDRCNPKYVLELFSTIKHFFELDNLSIIYLYNYNELWHLVKKEYGYESEQYIQKFVDYEIKLNNSRFYCYLDYSDDSFNRISIFLCQKCYNLNPREINNLQFIIDNHSIRQRNIDVVDYLLITHCVIKKLNVDSFDTSLVQFNFRQITLEDKEILEEEINNLSITQISEFKKRISYLI